MAGITYLINIQSGHFKIWGYQTMKDTTTELWHIITFLGRIGQNISTMAKKELLDINYWKAREYIENKRREKLNDGYVEISNYLEYCEKIKGI